MYLFFHLILLGFQGLAGTSGTNHTSCLTYQLSQTLESVTLVSKGEF